MQGISPAHSDAQARVSGKRAQRTFALAFAPVHKRHFGLALGLASGLLFAALTAVHLLRSPGDGFPMVLLAQYFYGYTVSWTGAVVALLWGGVVGFVAGWFLAFSRNLALAVSLFLTRTSAELTATSDFLDHI